MVCIKSRIGLRIALKRSLRAASIPKGKPTKTTNISADNTSASVSTKASQRPMFSLSKSPEKAIMLLRHPAMYQVMAVIININTRGGKKSIPSLRLSTINKIKELKPSKTGASSLSRYSTILVTQSFKGIRKLNILQILNDYTFYE